MNDREFDRHLRDLARDRRHGASELARRSLEIAAESARAAPAADVAALGRILEARCAAMVAVRPSMAPVANLLARWQGAVARLDSGDAGRFRREAAAAARALVEDSRRAAGQAAARAAKHIGPGRTLLTHSLSSTVLDLFRVLADTGVEAIVTESRPLCEGYEVARRLSEWRIPTTVITDAQAGLFMDEADAVVTGADALLADGGVVNKAGTYPLALVARDRGVPFYVCCEGFKRQVPGMPPPALQEMDADELGAPALADVRVRNVYFDVTPARLVTALFTDEED